MLEHVEIDGFRVGEMVNYDPAIGGNGPKIRCGRIVEFTVGARGNYARIQPYGDSTLPVVVKRTDQIEGWDLES
jgi:hypothetical protein